MRARTALSWIARESRGARGRLAFFAVCIAVGVAAVTGVAALGGALDAGVRARSKELTAGDLVVDARRPLPPELDAWIAEHPELVRADVRELATMAAVPGPDGDAAASTLVELKVVDGPYPLYGTLAVDGLALADRTLDEALGTDGVAVAPELLDTLDLARGDELLLGGARFRVRGVVLDEPDRLDISLVLGPRVFVSREGLDRTQLLGVGNRVRYRTLLRVEGGASVRRLEAYEEDLRARLPDADFLDIDTHDEAQPGVRRGIERFGRFLGLVALLSLLLGGIGVAQVVRTWLGTRTQAVAVLRALGLRPAEVLRLYLLQVVAVALVGSLAGAAVGATAPFLATRLAPDLLEPGLVPLLQPRAIARGVGLGVLVACFFALPPLTAIWRVSPARVLRAEVEPLPPPPVVRYGALGAAALAVLLAARLQGGEWEWALWFSGGVTAAALLLWGGARGVMWAVARLPHQGWNPLLRAGLAGLARPGAGTVGGVVALGLGVLVVASMALVQARLEDELAGALPEDAPSVFLVDVQPSQWDDVRAALQAEGAEALDSVPVLMARLASIDGEEVQARIDRYRAQDRRPPWELTREQRLTWLEVLPDDNVVVEGSLWTRPDVPEVSVEADFAEDLEVGIGSRLGFDVQGVRFELTVTSLRTVEWESFGINFFLVAEPGVFDDAPHFRIAVARLEPAAEVRLQDRLASEHPNVTVLRVRPILEKIGALMARIAIGVRLLGGVTIVVGLVLLFGAAAAASLARAREAALWKTLGLTRGRVAALFAVEYALQGVVAGLCGSLGAYLIARLFLTEVLDLAAELPWGWLPLLVLATAGLTAAAGLAANLRALATPPIRSLRA